MSETEFARAERLSREVYFLNKKLQKAIDSIENAKNYLVSCGYGTREFFNPESPDPEETPEHQMCADFERVLKDIKPRKS